MGKYLGSSGLTYLWTKIKATFLTASDVATVATSGSYNDLSNKPTIPDAQIQSDWNQSNTSSKDFIKNKPTIPDISGKQDVIDSTNKLSADLVEDGTTNKSYTATEKTKLAGIAAGAEVNVQANWNETNTSSDAYIQNKPTDLAYIGDTQGSATIANFDPQTDTVHIAAQTLSSSAQAQVRANIGAGTSNFSGNYNDLTNKPTIPDAVSGTNDGTNWTSITIGGTTKAIPSGGGSGSQVQSDWNQTDNTAVDYIKNKPNVIGAQFSYANGVLTISPANCASVNNGILTII